MLVRPQSHLKVGLGLGGSLPRRHPHTAGRLLLRPSLHGLPMGLVECLCCMSLLPLVSHPGDPGRGHNAFYDLAWMVSLHHACHVLLVKQSQSCFRVGGWSSLSLPTPPPQHVTIHSTLVYLASTMCEVLKCGTEDRRVSGP